MKKVMLFFIAYYITIIGCYGSIDSDRYSINQNLLQADSIVVSFVRGIQSALLKKNEYVFSISGKKIQSSVKKPLREQEKKTAVNRIRIKGMVPSSTTIRSENSIHVVMYMGKNPRKVPIDSLYIFQMKDLDSISIIFRSPQDIASKYGPGAMIDMILLHFKDKEYQKGKLDLLTSATDRYNRRPWKNDRGADSTLLLFVEDLYFTLRDENSRRTSIGQDTLDLQPQVVIDDKVVAIADLARYSIYDIAYMTVQFRRPKKRLFRPRPKDGVIFMTTYKQ